MYVPKHFEPRDETALWDFVETHSFGTLLTLTDGLPFASHLPFLVERGARRLHCHVARANPQWQHLGAGAHVLAIFAGPHGYVSPTWYVESNGVPTWNYAVVHARGTAVPVDDTALKRRHVEALAASNERGLEHPWKPAYDERRLAGIIGIEIAVTALEGKFKLSQNRSAADRHAIVAALERTGRGEDAALARLMTAAGEPS